MRGVTVIGLIALLGLAAPAQAQELAEIGNLTCSLAEESGSANPELGVGQAREMLCIFKLSARGAEETYTGTLQSAGDVRPFDKGVLMWTVKAPAATTMQPGLLQQSFAVDSAASANQAAPLIGERQQIVLLAAKKEMQQSEPAADSTKPTTVIISVVLKLKSTAA